MTGSRAKVRLAIAGAGAHARVVADCAEACGWKVIELFDEDPRPSGPFAVSGPLEALHDRLTEFEAVVVASGKNADRLLRHQDLLARGARATVLRHPGSIVSRHASLGAGTVVLAGAVINVGARLGDATVVNTGATVDHDCELADGVHVGPGAHLAGGVRVGDLAWIGVGAAVREYVTIGNRVCVGAGAVVVKSVADDLTVAGNPARPLEKKR